MSAQPIIERLLASEEPSIRWKVRVGVLGESPASPAIRRLREQIRTSRRVQTLLSRRDRDGRIGVNVYAKWYGAHWIMATLADIGYPQGDRSLLPLRDQLMDWWLGSRYYEEFEAESKARSYRRPGVPVMQGRHRRCASQQSNALWSVLGLGLADKRAQDLVERLLHWQWPDGGWNCDRNPDAHHSSFMESLIPLRALALVAREMGDRRAGKAAERAAEIFLKRGLYKSQSDGAVMHQDFVALHYPLYWHYDILGGLKVMAEAGFIDDPRCQAAVDVLEAKRLPDGGWPAEKRYYKIAAKLGSGTELVDWGGSGKRRTNEWVTADALGVLQAAGRIAC